MNTFISNKLLYLKRHKLRIGMLLGVVVVILGFIGSRNKQPTSQIGQPYSVSATPVPNQPYTTSVPAPSSANQTGRANKAELDAKLRELDAIMNGINPQDLKNKAKPLQK